MGGGNKQCAPHSSFIEVSLIFWKSAVQQQVKHSDSKFRQLSNKHGTYIRSCTNSSQKQQIGTWKVIAALS